jgi:molecular chaperone DnaK (HSP70)
VGIDLGTTNSLVATVRSAVPTVLADEPGRLLLPSVVHYGEADGDGRSATRRAPDRRRSATPSPRPSG